ncbi:hypothetical protein CRENPOLYSF2_1660004 [Crenothrix polyspora]|uniref:Uncharacterized protein n=1 Tax=Crenothrix polyspora TaxID=360316 RepID=A0A1R4H2M3_9GAMM|nr:hypothetical protein CRENPOLYSF2_1660004 [Crenothrix polyspora]
MQCQEKLQEFFGYLWIFIYINVGLFSHKGSLLFDANTIQQGLECA